LTIICFRSGIMAADTAAWSPENILVGHVRKITRSPGGVLASGCGSASALQWFGRQNLSGAFDAGCEDLPPHPAWGREDAAFILAYPEGRVAILNGAMLTMGADAPFYALGSPAVMAMGAMAAGASATEAVRICMEWHDDAKGDVQAEHLIPPAADVGDKVVTLVENPNGYTNETVVNVASVAAQAGFDTVPAAEHPDWRKRMGLG